jgi:hypothetical protein
MPFLFETSPTLLLVTKINIGVANDVFNIHIIEMSLRQEVNVGSCKDCSIASVGTMSKFPPPLADPKVVI